MSSLKDIMDVDFEPLESQAYRRSREAAQQVSRPSIAPSTDEPSPPDNNDNNIEQVPIKSRRLNRASSQPLDPSIASRTRWRSSVVGEGMNFSTMFQAGGSNQAIGSGSPQQSSRGPEPALDLPVKFTPVTGRISKAKKGVPVHTCDICRPIKTFTRAEHLRRHQLSHQKPAYPCTLEGCERAFHRPDLLARHLHRHETQGEKPYKSGDHSRASSTTSENRTPSLKVETTSQAIPASANQPSPSDALTPRSWTTTEHPITTSSSNPTAGMTASFPEAKFSSSPGSANSHQRPRSHALSESYYPATSPGSGPSRTIVCCIPTQTFVPSTQSSFDDAVYAGATSSEFGNYTATPQLPLLTIPEETYIPVISCTQENSPLCSSESDSNYSTLSEGPRSAQYWVPRDGPASINWQVSAVERQWPHRIGTAPEGLRGPLFEPLIDQYDAPYSASEAMTPRSISSQRLDVLGSHGYYHEPVVPSPRLSDPGLEIDRRKKELVIYSQLGALSIDTHPIMYPPKSPFQLDIYIDCYFQHFHKLFPIIHRPSFYPTENTLLSLAMAAIGTQYHGTLEARERGSEFNEAVRKGIPFCPTWPLSKMQAILLNEIFTRFRGRKTVVRLTSHFEEIYSRLLGLALRSELQQPNVQSEWSRWVETEAHQRLLSACFMFDVHQSIYHEQARSKRGYYYLSTRICLPCSDSLWDASKAIEWQALLSDQSSQPLHLVEQDVPPRDTLTTSLFTQSLLVCSFTARLPKRVDPAYPNGLRPNAPDINVMNLMNTFPSSPLAHVYLALYHTPLHDLLAISGETWVFAQKITPLSAFHASQSRLKTWSSSLSAAQATYHACRVLSSALSQPFYLPAKYGNINSTPTLGTPKTSSILCICDYWSLYISALICWAFGHRYQTSSSNGGSGNISHSNSSSGMSNIDINNLLHQVNDQRLKALVYVNIMLELGVEELITSKVGVKGDTADIVDAVRLRLEIESVGNKSGLVVDAVGVLGKIRVGGKGKWF